MTDVSYETSYFSDVFNYRQGRVPSQSFVDSFLSYAPAGGRWTVSLTAKNLENLQAYQGITWGRHGQPLGGARQSAPNDRLEGRLFALTTS